MGGHSHTALLVCWWTGLVLLVLGVPTAALHLTRYARRGTEVQGGVVRILVRRRGSSATVLPVVRFTDPASEREITGVPLSGRIPSAGWPGQAIAVRYLPGTPEVFQAGPQTGVFDACLGSLLVMTLGSIALVLTRWTDPDAIATSAVLAASAVAVGAAIALGRRAGDHERQWLLGAKGELASARIVGTLVVDGGAQAAHRYHPVLRFTAAGGEQVTGVDLATHDSRPCLPDGAEVPVRYVPEDPQVFRVEGTGGPAGRAGRRAVLAPNAVGLLAVLTCCGILITVGELLVGH
jgi:Protein of unknown function (DUF3592)